MDTMYCKTCKTKHTDGNSHIINQAFEVVSDVGTASEVGICGEMFMLDNQYVFYYGGKYL